MACFRVNITLYYYITPPIPSGSTNFPFNFSWESLSIAFHLEDPPVDINKICKSVFMKRIITVSCEGDSTKLYNPVCLMLSAFRVLIIHWGMLQRTMLQRTVYINKIRVLQRTQMLQRTRRNTIGRCSTRVRMTCRTSPL